MRPVAIAARRRDRVGMLTHDTSAGPPGRARGVEVAQESSVIHPRRLCLLAACALAPTGTAIADEPGLIARWPLAVDFKDAGPNALDATGRGVTFSAQAPGGKGTAAAFDGRGAHLTVPASPALSLGASDFTVALLVNTA